MKQKYLKVDPLYYELFQRALSKGDLRKIQILEEAIRQLTSQGIENVSLESISKRIGLKRAHVAHYFPSIGTIVDAAVRLITMKAQRITVEGISSVSTSLEIVRTVVDGAFRWADQYPDHARLMALFYYYATWNKKYRALHTKIRIVGAERLSVAIKSHRPQLSKKSVEQFATHIQCLITGYLLHALTVEMEEPINDFRKRLNRHIEKLLNESTSID